MTLDVDAFPLAWPHGKPRTRTPRRGAFQVTLDRARRDLLRSLELLGVKRSDIVISTNVPLRLDGEFRARARLQEDDAGVALYFGWKGKDYCFAVDKYEDVRSNTRAIGLAIEALRALQRAGVDDLLEQAFSGFARLPASIVPVRRAWRDVLEYSDVEHPTRDELKQRWRALSAKHHPDRGGSRESFDDVQRAYEDAIRELHT